MNVEKLKRLQAQVRIGGKGTPRRKKKVTHQTAATDDKKLQSSLKKLSVSTIPGIEEVNIIKDDLTVIHFNNPKVQASLSSNTYAVTGHGETKKVVQMLPDILPQLGHETVVQLRMFANSITNNQKVDGSGEEKYKNNFRSNDDDDVPTLVSDFDEIAKSEDLTTGRLKMKLDNNVSNINVLKSDDAQDIIKSDNAKKTLTLNSDNNIEANLIITPKERDDNDVLVIESFKNKEKCQSKKDIPEPDIKDEKKIQFQENNAKSLFKEKKSGDKNDTSGKKGSDSKKAKEAHQANKNNSLIIDFKDDTLHSKPDVNVLIDLTESNSVALKTDDSLDQSTKTLENKTHGLLEIISDKQSDSMVNFEAKENNIQNIEAGCTISKNEICKSNENLSVVESLCSEPNKKEDNDISKVLSMEIETTKLVEKNQSIKIESIVCNEFITKETKCDDAGNENKTLNEETASEPLLQESNEEKIKKLDDGVISRDTPNLILSLKMEKVDMKPKVVVKGDYALNESLEEVPIMATLESTNVKNADLTLNVEGKTLDNFIIHKIVCNDVKEIEALQKHLEEDTLNSITLLEDSKTEDKQAKEIGNENKIQTEIQALKKATSVKTIIPRINNLTNNETKGYQDQEIQNSHGHSKEQTLSKEIEVEQNSQQAGELIGKISLTLDQNKEKDINLDECITKECKSEAKIVKIQENENNNALLKTQSLATDITAKTELEEFQQTGEQKNIETLFTLGQEKEKDISSSEKKVGSNAKITSKSVKQPPTKQNETKNQSLPGTSTKISTDLKKSSIVGKPKQLPLQKNRAHQISEGIIPKTQQLQKSAEGTLVKSEKETAQKTKQHQTVPTKTQKPMEVRLESAPKVKITQNTSVSNKGATEMTFPTPTTESGVTASTSQLVNQISYTAEKHLTSNKTAKASLNKNETANKVLKVPNKTDTNSASTGTTQKQTNPKVKQAKSTSEKTAPTSKISQPKAKSSQKPVDLNERAS